MGNTLGCFPISGSGFTDALLDRVGTNTSDDENERVMRE